MTPVTNYDANSEFLKKSMLERGTSQFGVDQIGNVALCQDMVCAVCLFKDAESTCQDLRKEWLSKEAAPSIDDQVLEAIHLEVVKCCNTPCDKCIYHDLSPHTCISTHIRNTIITKFKVTNKED